jgi:hypothetical protein
MQRIATSIGLTGVFVSRERLGSGAAAVQWKLECRGGYRAGHLQEDIPLPGRDREWSRSLQRATRRQRLGAGTAKRAHPDQHRAHHDTG